MTECAIYFLLLTFYASLASGMDTIALPQDVQASIILRPSPSPEIGRIVAGMASSMKIHWVAWLGLLSLSYLWLLQVGYWSYRERREWEGDQRLTKGIINWSYRERCEWEGDQRLTKGIINWSYRERREWEGDQRLTKGIINWSYRERCEWEGDQRLTKGIVNSRSRQV